MEEEGIIFVKTCERGCQYIADGPDDDGPCMTKDWDYDYRDYFLCGKETVMTEYLKVVEPLKDHTLNKIRKIFEIDVKMGNAIMVKRIDEERRTMLYRIEEYKNNTESLERELKKTKAELQSRETDYMYPSLHLFDFFDKSDTEKGKIFREMKEPKEKIDYIKQLHHEQVSIFNDYLLAYQKDTAEKKAELHNLNLHIAEYDEQVEKLKKFFPEAGELDDISKLADFVILKHRLLLEKIIDEK